MSLAICFGLFLPLVGFLSLVLLSGVLDRRQVGILACTVIALSFFSFALLLGTFLQNGMQPAHVTLFQWIPVPGIDANVSLHLDALSLLMTLIITGVGCLIHIYSIGYMDDEEDFARYFAFLNFFVFSMLLLVLAGDLLVLFAGWEGVGLASYLLIGFWYRRPAAAAAATKAFVMNRIGDLGLLLGILLTFHLFETGDMGEINRRASLEFIVGAPALTLLTLLYFVGATGKSAQFPLYSWLPDAMEGPTPVSALIHAATMVTAGVYLIVRMHALFLLAPITLQVVGLVGAGTSLFAALCAVGQTDLKKVLAYSTVSQLGLMFLACGAGAFYAAMFHLTSHAFIKALLFLSAGNVVHMMHGETSMEKMGGLARIFGKTQWFFLIGSLALAGLPPFAAFFSKDLILEQEYLAGYHFLFYLGLAASVLTGFYLMRAYCLTFLGPLQLSLKARQAVKEAPCVMWVPVAILAFLAIVGGLLGYPLHGTPLLETFLHEVGLTMFEAELHSGFVLTPETWVAISGALCAVAIAAWLYTRGVYRLAKPFSWLKQAFYVDNAYEQMLVKPLKRLSSWIVDVWEPQFFEGAIWEIGLMAQRVSRWLQRLQSGQIRSYLAWMVAGSALLMIYLVR